MPIRIDPAATDSRALTALETDTLDAQCQVLFDNHVKPALVDGRIVNVFNAASHRTGTVDGNHGSGWISTSNTLSDTGKRVHGHPDIGKSKDNEAERYLTEANSNPAFKVKENGAYRRMVRCVSDSIMICLSDSISHLACTCVCCVETETMRC